MFQPASQEAVHHPESQRMSRLANQEGDQQRGVQSQRMYQQENQEEDSWAVREKMTTEEPIGGFLTT